MTEEVLRSVVGLARRFHADESGTTAIEYALIAAGIGATIAATVYNMGSTLKTVWWDKIANVF
jgi:pilus assembly protein Flp/PilA